MHDPLRGALAIRNLTLAIRNLVLAINCTDRGVFADFHSKSPFHRFCVSVCVCMHACVYPHEYAALCHALTGNIVTCRAGIKGGGGGDSGRGSAGACLGR